MKMLSAESEEIKSCWVTAIRLYKVTCFYNMQVMQPSCTDMRSRAGFVNAIELSWNLPQFVSQLGGSLQNCR